MKLGVKAKRNIGLIALTIVVIVAIILVVYFVQKSDDDSKLKYGHIGQAVSTSRADICVKDWRKAEDVEVYTVENRKCVYLLRVEIKAKKNLKVSSSTFEIKDSKNLTAEGLQRFPSGNETLEVIACEGEIVLKKGERNVYEILYEVENNRVASYFLYAFGARIDLGGTVTNTLS